jgi:hypothetical protein
MCGAKKRAIASRSASTPRLPANVRHLHRRLLIEIMHAGWYASDLDAAIGDLLCRTLIPDDPSTFRFLRLWLASLEARARRQHKEGERGVV